MTDRAHAPRKPLQCLRCNWSWFPRLERRQVRICPRCKSPRWDERPPPSAPLDG